jgi:UDP-glucose 4-epimerase
LKIIITGISGYLGSELTKTLSQYEIIGVDIKEPEKIQENVIFIKKSILDDDLSIIFKKYNPEVCIHLAWNVNPVHKKNLSQAFDLDYNGTKNILRLCRDFEVKHIIFVSSTLAYGALKDNPSYLIEESPLRAKNTFHYAYHKKKVEIELIQPFIRESKSLVTVLRPTGFLGPKVNNYVSNILRAKILPVMMSGRNTKIQFLHIKDLVEVIDLIVGKRISGIYNIAPDDDISMNDIPKILPGHKIYIFESLARFLISFAWFFHMYKAPSAYLDFVRYEFIVSNDKIKKELNWSPKYSTEDAIRSIIDFKNIKTPETTN